MAAEEIPIGSLVVHHAFPMTTYVVTGFPSALGPSSQWFPQKWTVPVIYYSGEQRGQIDQERMVWHAVTSRLTITGDTDPMDVGVDDGF